MGKSKSLDDSEVKVKVEPGAEDEGPSHADKLRNCSRIAHPMAGKKLAKKCYKLIKKAAKTKKAVLCGIKLVQKHVRLGRTGLVVFAGDVSPIEVMCHMPALCEDKSVPYCYVPSRQDLGSALGIKRGCLMVVVKDQDEYRDMFNECTTEIKTLPTPL